MYWWRARREMLGIQQKMGELRGLHGKATLSRFDDTNDDEVQVSRGSGLALLHFVASAPTCKAMAAMCRGV
jgi:hypothetical protein